MGLVHALTAEEAKEAAQAFEDTPPGDGGRWIVAKKYGIIRYIDSCGKHGYDVAFSGRTGKCEQCEMDWGKAAYARAEDRKAARREGFHSFMTDCEIHGLVPHSTAYGTCLQCYTAGGKPRAKATDDARTLARKAGETAYTGVCDLHGSVPHSVQHGRCLHCYTTGGAPRARGVVKPEARRAPEMPPRVTTVHKFLRYVMPEAKARIMAADIIEALDALSTSTG